MTNLFNNTISLYRLKHRGVSQESAVEVWKIFLAQGAKTGKRQVCLSPPSQYHGGAGLSSSEGFGDGQ